MATDNRVALVTGAGSGIGKAVSLALQADGFHVVLAGRRQAPLQETAASAASDGGEMLVCPADISDPDSVAELFARTVQKFGRLDVLFNNAGIMPPATPVEDMPVAIWRKAVDINLTGAFLCAREAIRIMKGQDPKGGRIINNGSISAAAPRPHSAAYTATKHAITGLSKSLALDGRDTDIACSQIDIGNAATEMTDLAETGFLQPNGTTMPEPRMDVRHVANAVLGIANLPLSANVPFMTLMATKMPLVGRG